MSDFKLVVDSCCDVPKDLISDIPTEFIPFSMTVDEVVYRDDESFVQSDFLAAMKKSQECAKSGCPTPFDFEQKMNGAKYIFIVTISGPLSACSESAMMAKEAVEKNGTKVHIFDSKSAACGEVNVYLKICELIREGKTFEEIIPIVEEHIKSMKTMFVLEDLGNLIKNGRMSKIAGKMAALLSICPILYAVEGEIEMLDKAIGIKKALTKLVDGIGERLSDEQNKIITISHCNDLERAKDVKSKIEKKYNFKDVIICSTGGLSTMYANQGGIIIAY